MTDSGGVQEEAPSLGKPVLVLRDTTERPEALEAGATVLVGTSVERIIAVASAILNQPAGEPSNVVGPNPYGDGHAAERIVHLILSTFARE
jgi:UDP-N-acetylglucosamine 2-epimerase